MEILILDKKNDIVYVNSECGQFYATWCSKEPIIGKKYHVELDIDQILTEDDIKISNICVPSIECKNDKVFVVGFLEEIDYDVIVLRLLKSIIMLQITPNIISTHYLGNFVCVEIKEIGLFDIDI